MGVEGVSGRLGGQGGGLGLTRVMIVHLDLVLWVGYGCVHWRFHGCLNEHETM